MAQGVIEITDANFENEVLKSELPVLVDFWAPWCAPCRFIAPVVEEIAKEYAGKLKVGRLNVDENPEVSARYGIRAIPTLILFKNGESVAQTMGAQPKEALKEFIDQNI